MKASLRTAVRATLIAAMVAVPSFLSTHPHAAHAAIVPYDSCQYAVDQATNPNGGTVFLYYNGCSSPATVWAYTGNAPSNTEICVTPDTLPTSPGNCRSGSGVIETGSLTCKHGYPYYASIGVNGYNAFTNSDILC